MYSFKTSNRLISLANQRVPAKEIFNRNVDLDLIADLEVQSLFLKHLMKISNINPFYVKTILRSFINLLESKDLEVIEDAYEMACSNNILNAKEMMPTDADILEYCIGGFSDTTTGSSSVRIKETPKIISGSNTTGLRTWDAALYLANYLNSNQVDLSGCSILELGTGTGLVGLSLVKYYHKKIGKLKEIIFTDGAAELIDNLTETLVINNITPGSTDLPEIKAYQLYWGTTNISSEDFVREPSPGIDYLIGADITYDSSVVSILCSTIFDFFQKGTKGAIIAATIRNEQTIDSWEKELDSWFGDKWQKQTITRESIESIPNCWFSPATPKIRIYNITNV